MTDFEWSRSVRKAASELEPLAAAVQRLGVLLAAGVAPVSGWGYVAEGVHGASGRRVRQIAAAAERGDSVAASILDVANVGPDEQAWRALAAAWIVATDAGAPLASTLVELAASLRSLSQNNRDLETALAAPVATVRMVLSLPLVGIVFGLALGFDTLGVLFATPIGLACLVIGGTLLLVARAWSRRLVARARPRDTTPGLELELIAVAVSGGASISRARTAVSDAWKRCGLADAQACGAATQRSRSQISAQTAAQTASGSTSAVDDILELSRKAGVPAAGLLRSEAIEQRRRARSDGERRAATLAVTLMLPLGLCILPAFMVLGVAPLLIAVISSTVDTF